jgi:hypothetical protein
MKVLSQSFPKTQVPFVKRNETEVSKNKIFKPQVPNMSFNPFFFFGDDTCTTSVLQVHNIKVHWSGAHTCESPNVSWCCALIVHLL